MIRPLSERPTVNLDLVGIDGNAMVILASFSRQAKKCGWTKEEIKEVVREAKSGDYDHLLQTIIKHIDL